MRMVLLKTHILLLFSSLALTYVSGKVPVVERQIESTALVLREPDGAIKERVKRQSEGEAGPPAGDDAGAIGGISGGLGGFLGTVKNVLNEVAGLTSTFGGITGSIGKVFDLFNSFQQMKQQRRQMEQQERQFQQKLALETAKLCQTVCVTSWAPWTHCSKNCGGGGVRKRARTRTESNMCQGQPCPYHLEETEPCNYGCANNGMVDPDGACQCPRGFSGVCCNNEIYCSFPGSPTHGKAEPAASAKFGGVITYSCSDGHALVGEENRICEANSRWGGTQPRCEKITCAQPQSPTNGQNLNIQAEYQFGQEVFFRCDYGYDLAGPSKSKCTNINGSPDGIWTGFTPLCLPVNCGNPGYPLYGAVNGSEFLLGDVVHYSCRSGYRLIGSESRECLPSGRWGGHKADCELITCEEPLIPRHGRLRRPRESYYMGLTISYQCDEGYTLEGTLNAICEEDTELSHLGGGGQWSVEPPICKPTICGDPGTIENGAKDGTLFYYPNNVTFVCFDGYVLQGAAEIHCGYNGVWSAPPPTCSACPENAYRTNRDGTNECIPCPENTHTVTGASTSVEQCVCNVGWTGPPGGPCTEIVCPALTAPGNGQRTCDGNKYQNKCDFSCDEGYILDKGSSRRTCQEDGLWTGTDSQCTACPLNTYKSDERSCLPCPVHSHTTNTASIKNQCICDDGYQGPAGGPCSDANECSANGGKGPCDDQCRNTNGSYVCECSIPGHVIDETVDRHVCLRDQTCRNLTETDAPAHGGLVCHWYREQNSQQCTVKCNPGYEFPSRINNYESCGDTTGYKWSHEERGEVFEPCVEEFFPGIRLEANSSYFVRDCRDLTPDEQQKVKEDFAKLLTDEGICMRRDSKVCEAKNVGIICGSTSKRRKRGTGTVDEVNFNFELAAKALQPSDCDQICPMLRIPAARCEALCVKTYRRFLLALMQHTKQSIETLFSDRRKVSFLSGTKAFQYQSGTLKTSDVIIGCPTGMVKGEICVPCAPGSRYSETDNTCKKCSQHTYQANPQQLVCNPCPSGTHAPFEGATGCNRCPANKWGNKCQGTCHCEHGLCDPSAGRCVCYSGWEGSRCNIDIQSCTAESCYPGVKCTDIPAPGTGFRCGPCPSGYHGDGTICDPVGGRRKREIEERYSAQFNVMQLASLGALSMS